MVGLRSGSYYRSLGITVSRVMTDNGSCYRSKAFVRAYKRFGVKPIRTRPYTPQTNGKAAFFSNPIRLKGANTPEPRQEVLENLGWRLHRIWSTDWFRNPARQTDRLLAAIREAESRSRVPTAPEFAPEEQTEAPETPPEVIESGGAQSDETADNGSDPSTEYKECSLVVPYGRNLLDLTTAEIGRLALAVVEAEGPVHTEEVARRIREAFGLQKTGNRILKHVRDSLLALSRTKIIQREREFWCIPGRELQAVRTRRSVPLPLPLNSRGNSAPLLCTVAS
jgi:very-short-patch-repair endonuclease